MIAERLKVVKRGTRLLNKQPPKDTSKIQWSDLVPYVLAVYNNKNRHRIIGMTPAEAKNQVAKQTPTKADYHPLRNTRKLR